METIEITYNSKRTRRLFKKYLDYERQRQIKRLPSKWIIGFSFILVVIGVAINSLSTICFGVLIATLFIAYLVYFYYKYEAIFKNYMKAVEQRHLESESTFTFGFDSNGLSYVSPNTNQQTKWNIIGRYEVNEGDIYLFYKNDTLFDIISESIIGKEKYSKFLKILTEKYS